MPRPSDYNPDIAAEILSMMTEGMSLRKICMEDNMPSSASVYRWLMANETFRENYAKAQQDRATAFAEEIVDISDDTDGDTFDDGTKISPNSVNVARHKLRVDTRKWLMSRLDPKRYGDKVTQEHTGEVSITQITRKIIDPNA